MEVAARWGDAINVNLPLTGADDATTAVAQVHAACAAVGRDPATVISTGWARLELTGRASDRPDTLAGSPDEVTAHLRAIEAAGVDHVTFYVGDPDDNHRYPALTRQALEGLGPVLQALRL